MKKNSFLLLGRALLCGSFQFILLLGIGHKSIFAQQKLQKDSSLNSKKNVRISDALKELRTKLGIYILFEDKLVDGLTVADYRIDMQQSAEKNLDVMLRNSDLGYKKTKDKTYLIVSKKRKTKDQVQGLNTTIDTKQLDGNTPFLSNDTVKNNADVKIQTKTDIAKELLISGVVKDEKGDPLANVSVIETGTKNGIVTDLNGVFKLRVNSKNQSITVSNSGYASQVFVISNQKTLTIVLKATNKDLDDVVVVGYGVQKKISNTGAQSSMSGKLLVQSPVANISNSLVGRVSGLFASQGSGEPGNDQSTLKIRGVGTFNGSTDPLVLVDGIQVDNYNSIDPNEIENVTVLKDASSTAVYGIRGANGVIIITTKRGKVGPARVSYTFNNAINNFTAVRSQMNSYDYAISFNKAAQNDAYVNGTNYVPKFAQSDIDKYKLTVDGAPGADPIFYPNIDWFKVILKKTSSQQQHNLSISGGTDKLRYVVSVGYFNQGGLFNNTTLSPGYDAEVRFQRYNFRSNLNYNVNKRFRIAMDVSSQIENRSGNALSTQTVIDNIQRANPLSSPGIVDNKLIIIPVGGTIQSNPISSLYQAGYQRAYRGYLNGSVRMDHDLDFITKGLSTHAQVAYQNFNGDSILNTKPTTTVINYLAVRQLDGSVKYLPQSDATPFSFTETITKRRRTTAEFAIDYKRKFGDHNVTALLLYNQIKSIDPTYSFAVPNGYQSYVGRATYDYMGRYLAEVNFAYNGTENFAPGHRFGVFPAYSLGWIVSDEKFFPKSDIFNFLKIRGSYGQVGNDQIGVGFLYSGNRFLFRPTAWTFSGGYRYGEVATAYNQLLGALEGRASNPDLTWERTLKTDLGIEMAFWKKKITATVDFFKGTTNSILTIPQTVSAYFAAAVPALNIGRMENGGYEVELALNDNLGKFNYQVKANYSYAHNKILFQDEVTPLFPYERRTGQRYGQFFGLVAEGLYNTWDEVNDAKRPVYGWQGNKIQPGDIRYKDVNGDGKINNDDFVPIGYSQVPEKTFGISLVGEYKGWSLSVLFQGVGNVSLPYTRRFTQAFYDAQPAGALDNLLESWTPERYAAGLPINFPRFSLGSNGGSVNNYQSSTFFTVDASYIRLKNLELGYTFSGGIMRRAGLSSTRLFVNANNLFTWSHLPKGVDPESPPTATNNEAYPLVRTINMGININL